MAQNGGTYSPQAAAAVPAPVEPRPCRQSGDDKPEKVPSIEKGGDGTGASGGYISPSHALEVMKAPPQAGGPVNEEKDWTVVQHPEAETEENISGVGCSSHFDITLGWGRYKVTVFSCDMSFKRYPGNGSQARPRDDR